MAIKDNAVAPSEKMMAGMGFGLPSNEFIGAPKFIADVEVVSPEGSKWRDRWENAVQLEGKVDIMNRYFGQNGGSTYNSWYVGIHSTNATFATGFMSAISTYGEVGGYSVSNGTNLSRGRFTMASNLGQQSYTTTMAFQFTTSTFTVSGLFVGNSAANVTGSSGGVLYSMGTFQAGGRTVFNGDTLNVTLTLSMA